MFLLGSGDSGHHEKSALRKWYDKVTGAGHHTITKVKSKGKAGLHALRQSGESVIVGGVLGAVHAESKTGLDVNVKGHTVPVDAALGVVAMLASVPMHEDAHDNASADLANAGAAALSVFAFRKAHDFVAQKKAQTPAVGAAKAGPSLAAHGDYDGGSNGSNDISFAGDPVIAAAKSIQP